MIVATPIDGGHYFIDVPAGFAAAALGLWAAHATAAAAQGVSGRTAAHASLGKTPHLVGGGG